MQRMLRLAVVDAVELGLEHVEQREPVAVDLVAELVDEPREAVDRHQVPARLAAEHARGDGEVLLRRERQDGALAREETLRGALVAGGRGHRLSIARARKPARAKQRHPPGPGG